MKCPKCKVKLAVVWVGKPDGPRSIYELEDVQYCWECGNLFLGKPEEIKIHSSEQKEAAD